MTCEKCHEEICEHGVCWCAEFGEGHCRKCSDRQQLEWEAEREVIWQRDVIGPMFGFTEDDSE